MPHPHYSTETYRVGTSELCRLVIVSVDDHLLIQLNGHGIDTEGCIYKHGPIGTGNWINLNLTPLMVTGTNYLSITAWNEKGAASIDGELSVGTSERSLKWSSGGNWPEGRLIFHETITIIRR